MSKVLSFLCKTDVEEMEKVHQHAYNRLENHYFLIIVILISFILLSYIILRFNLNKIQNLETEIKLLKSIKYEDMIERYLKLENDLNMININNFDIKKSRIHSVAYIKYLKNLKNMTNFCNIFDELFNYDVNIIINSKELLERFVVICEIHYFWLKKNKQIYDNFVLHIEYIECNYDKLSLSNYPDHDVNEFNKIIDNDNKCYNVFIDSIPGLLAYEEKINMNEFRKKYLKILLS